MTDSANLNSALALIKYEYQRAAKKFPPFNSAHEGYAVLLEEVDELWEEIKHGNNPNEMLDEAIQVGAMALRFIIDISRNPEPAPKADGLFDA